MPYSQEQWDDAARQAQARSDARRHVDAEQDSKRLLGGVTWGDLLAVVFVGVLLLVGLVAVLVAFGR